MSTKYFALLTQLGADKLANAAALGTKIEITHMAVGDGGGSLPTPDTKQTKLINEKRRAAINTLSIDPKNTNQIISEQVIPESEGGWWIREIGLFDKDGILIAVGNCAESYKPQLQEGSGRTQTIRMILIVSSTESVTLKVDPSVVLATREYVDGSIQKHENSRNHPDATLKEKGFVILSSAVDSNSETHAATPKAVKAAYDFANAANNNANGRVPSGRKVNGKALSEDIHLKASDVDAYNKTETDARVNDAKAQAKAANDNADGRVPAGRKVNGKALNADISLNSGDVGAYSKGETDIRVDEAKALANAANQNAANANNNANTRLEKNQNGADIPNKPKFVENLGLAETVEKAKNAVSANGGRYVGNFSFGQVETVPTEQNKAMLVSLAGKGGRPARELASYSQYEWYTNSVQTGVVRGGSSDIFSYGININNKRVLNLFPNGTLEVAKIDLKDYSNFDSHYKNTIELSQKALPKSSLVQVSGSSTEHVMSQKAVTEALAKAVSIDVLHPVGIVLWFAQNKNPNNLFPGTSWKYIGENRTVRLAAANGSNVLSTGGNDTKWLSVNQIPKHSHSFSANTSNAGGHNHSRGDMNITGYLPSVIQHGDDVFGGAFARNGQNKPAVDYTDHWKELTTFDASRTWTGHTSWGGEHIHNVSGTTSEIGKGEGFDVTNSYVMLMGWYRIS
ncbi:phage tail-collar fiber domain-containing protein [Xenorhabdus bovienii]|uniref:phage tail-collar fiber domain-containing protein n=1 Tax=Xenorhabdus bovienii TaxID=40576 RepID=UPI003DA5BBD9